MPSKVSNKYRSRVTFYIWTSVFATAAMLGNLEERLDPSVKNE